MATPDTFETSEYDQVRKQIRNWISTAFIFSLFINALLLTSPIYMLQIYDRVLSSGSEETLVAITLIACFLYSILGILDFLRSRILVRTGCLFQIMADAPVFRSALQRRAGAGTEAVDAVRRLFTSPAMASLLDLPWTPLFLAALFLFHPWLGFFALAGMLILIGLAALNQICTQTVQTSTNASFMQAEETALQVTDNTEIVNALGLFPTLRDRWRRHRWGGLAHQLSLSDRLGFFTSIGKATRLLLQSMMLGMGAFLALKNEISPGAIVAGSILLGRALAPIEQTIAGWSVIKTGVAAHKSLQVVLTTSSMITQPTALVPQNADLVVKDLTVVPPDDTKVALRLISFSLAPGEALGVIGASGAGKTTLARALTAVWQPISGSIRLDGISLTQFDPDILGRQIGYLPQTVRIFDGTVKENIARLSSEVCDQDVIRAARDADAHEMILRLPQGYDTQISMQNTRLSGGQLQRIGLARALYRDPVLLVLDEPNSNLDNNGSVALNAAIKTSKEAGRLVLIMAHRPSAIQYCDKLLVLEDGIRKAYGPRDDVLKATVLNHSEVQRGAPLAGVA